MSYMHTSSIIPENYLGWYSASTIAFLLFMILAVDFIINFKSTGAHESVPRLTDKHTNKALQDGNNRGEIDIRYVKVERGIWMLFHYNNQLITPNRATSFIYDNNDRLGSSISNMLISNSASSVSVSIDGIMTKGFELSGLPTGDIINSKIINVKPLWVNQSSMHNNITTMGVPLPLYTNRWSITTTNPAISSMRDNRGRDIRNNINFIT